MSVVSFINQNNGMKVFRYGRLLIEQGFSNSNPSRIFYTVKFRSFVNDHLYIPVGSIYTYTNPMSTVIKTINDHRFYAKNRELEYRQQFTDIQELILSLNQHLISVMN